jgi:hypothetical protein
VAYQLADKDGPGFVKLLENSSLGNDQKLAILNAEGNGWTVADVVRYRAQADYDQLRQNMGDDADRIVHRQS